MPVLREDYSTHTLADAGRFQQARTSPERPDAPSLREAEEMEAAARWDKRRKAEADERARARGEYVPHPAWASDLSSMAVVLAQHGIFNVTLEPTRDGIARVDSREPLDAVAIGTALNDYQPGRYDVRDVNGVVWVKGTYTNDEEPPF